jgi:hypothetical protein
MSSSGILRRVALVRTDFSEEHSVSVIKVTILSFRLSVGRLLVMANVPSSPNLVTLIMEALGSSETSLLKELYGVTSQKTTFFN